MHLFSGFYLVLGIILWIALAFWPARVASRKGHSFIGYFIFSIIFFFLALVVAYMVPDRNKTEVPTNTPPAGQ